MPSLIDIRRRIRAVKSTQQITKAMKMVAAANLRRSQERILNARPMAQPDRARAGQRGRARRPVGAPAARAAGRWPTADPVLLIVMTADKGMCGSFNANIIRAASNHIVEHADRRSRSASSAGAAATTSSRRGYPMRFELVNITPEAGVRPRAGDRDGRDRGVHRRGEVDEVLPRLQRVQVGAAAADRHQPAAAAREGRVRAGRPGGDGRLPLRADRAGDLRRRAAAPGRATRSTRRCWSRPPRRTPRRWWRWTTPRRTRRK